MSSFKAHEKRKKTLLVEYKNQFKANKFVDKRIGENDTSLSLDEKMFKRFVVERQKRKGGGRKMKTNKYNLNEEDEEEFGGNNKNNVDLTHYGQSIAQMEKFDRGDLSDDNEDDETDLTRGKIGAEIVSDSFFGGFKSNEDSKKSRKDWIEEMIAKSKQAKYERQKERDRTLDMTEELDKEWKNIMPLIGSMNKKLKDEEDAKIANSLDKAPKADEFDVLVKKLQFDPKGKPTDKTKSAEEMRKAEAEETKRQEKELKERMDKEVEVTNEDEKIISKNKKGIKIKKAPANHQSVDDMDFNDPEYLQMWEKEEILKRQKEERKKEEEEAALKRAEELDGEEDEVENEEEGDEEEEEDEEEDEDEDEEDEEEDEENEEDGEESEGSLDEEDDEEEEETKEAKKSEKKKPAIEKEPTNNLSRLDELKKLLTSYSNLFKSDSSKPNSKAKIDTEKLNSLTKSIYDLTFNYCSKKSLSAVKNDPATLVALFREMLVEINSVYLQRRLNDRRFPDLEKLFKFKLISSVFPTSDYRHQIVTPCLIIMTRYLTECPIQYVSDLFRGLFLCNLCYDFTLRSKRFIPECIQFLNGVLYLAIDWKSRKISLPNFYSSSICENIKKTKFNLICSKKTDLKDLSLVETSLNESQELDDKLKTSLIVYTLDLITAFVSLNESIVSFKEIFHLTNLLLGYLDKEIYPKEINERVEEVQALISEFGNKEREYLKCLNRKPVVNKLYEPRVEAKSKFDPKHHNSVISERQLLRRKYKKEMKSAIKEIRQDNVFLARVQLKEKMDKDAKRAQKVKEIMGSLANQEGEYQKIKRQKI